VTDDDGTFALGDLSPGRYELTVHRHGYDSASAQFAIPSAGPITVVLRRGR